MRLQLFIADVVTDPLIFDDETLISLIGRSLDSGPNERNEFLDARAVGEMADVLAWAEPGDTLAIAGYLSLRRDHRGGIARDLLVEDDGEIRLIQRRQWARSQ